MIVLAHSEDIPYPDWTADPYPTLPWNGGKTSERMEGVLQLVGRLSLPEVIRRVSRDAVTLGDNGYAGSVKVALSAASVDLRLLALVSSVVCDIANAILRFKGKLSAVEVGSKWSSVGLYGEEEDEHLDPAADVLRCEIASIKLGSIYLDLVGFINTAFSHSGAVSIYHNLFSQVIWTLGAVLARTKKFDFNISKPLDDYGTNIPQVAAGDIPPRLEKVILASLEKLRPTGPGRLFLQTDDIQIEIELNKSLTRRKRRPKPKPKAEDENEDEDEDE